MSPNPKSTAKAVAAKALVNVGSLADMGKRFASAWKQAETGNPISQIHINLLYVQTIFETLSRRRVYLLRRVRQHGCG